jgi:hypothetical protein
VLITATAQKTYGNLVGEIRKQHRLFAKIRTVVCKFEEEPFRFPGELASVIKASSLEALIGAMHLLSKQQACAIYKLCGVFQAFADMLRSADVKPFW